MTTDKSPHLPTHVSVQRGFKSRPIWACAALALLGYYIYNYIGLAALLRPDSAFATGITWWPCPDITTTECAYLTVPRDYAHPEANDTVSIFMRKVPATVTGKAYLGSILVNPGGPGGSGSGIVASAGQRFSAMVDGRYDIIGFDPRGVNMTTPKLGCYENEAQAIHASYKQTLLGILSDAQGSPSLPSSVRARMEHAYLTRLNASFTASSLACLEYGNRPMLKSLSTAYVVQDIERIVGALGEDGLNFWGRVPTFPYKLHSITLACRFSYGTVLGSTFAAMRPHLVKRMVLDGVSNAESYHKDIYQWGTLDGFFDSCVKAGPDRCAFARAPSGKVSSEGSELRSRLEALYSKLRDEPVPVPKSSTGPGILTASEVKRAIFTGLYSPRSWPGLARAISEAEAGKPQLLYDIQYSSFEVLKHSDGNENVFNRYMEHQLLPVTISAIMCSDSEEPRPKSLDQYAEYTHELDKIAPIGEVWAVLAGFCSTWKIRPGQRYDGPWSVEEGLKKTRFPILYASLDADPVTPLSAAQKMAKSFGNDSAALLVQEGFGHCTIAHPSLCTAKAIRDYFVNGKVPAPGTFCQPEPGYLFPGNETKAVSTLSAEDQKLWEALMGLGDISPQFRPL